MAITVTFDVEDAGPATRPAAFVAKTEMFLDFLAARGIRGTFFIVADLAPRAPDLIRRIAHGGHEVALHGLHHLALDRIGPGALLEQLARGRGMLEDVAQVSVAGFRAPYFSLTAKTGWAVEEISAAGLSYSSSALPARSPLYGWPGIPRAPFRWPNGLIELPCLVAGIGTVAVPYLGGVYARYLPRQAIERLAARTTASEAAWSYTHPYDLDPDEPFHVMPGLGWLSSRILHARRGQTLDRIDWLIAAAGGSDVPLIERCRNLPVAALAAGPVMAGSR